MGPISILFLLLQRFESNRNASDIEQRGGYLRSRVPAIACGILLLLCADFGGAADTSKDKVRVDEKSFRCIRDMTPVRHFFVDNLLGNLEASLKVANSPTGGGEYPPGTVIVEFPNKPMVKHEKGYNPKTYDWEFYILDISKGDSKIVEKGFAEISSPFGGSCFGCHDNADRKWDLVCGLDHNCVNIPVTRAMSGALQRTDPRCKNGPVSAEDAEALKLFKALPKGM